MTVTLSCWYMETILHTDSRFIYNIDVPVLAGCLALPMDDRTRSIAVFITTYIIFLANPVSQQFIL